MGGNSDRPWGSKFPLVAHTADGPRVTAVVDRRVAGCQAGGRRAFPLPPCHGTACTCDPVPLRGCCTYLPRDRGYRLGTYTALLWLLLWSRHLQHLARCGAYDAVNVSVP